mmetsp:Transcript_11963/g.16450  ORF Transcript_11963/g.16450 Transcript_11963/m.16450 type:complete len:104 (+) Transcript_11963:1589-1900(+)|eukprot:CAMPEP_0176385922 /NCGR_PEP_ID=MMETSP0126-20121128/35525_1 /TAXON_ID=141414 ORGANISM="Strombidinopsis acuminatum, Strain SPMC142" /NCGR_SAMPLE_ID=MMETSP0126 /ASSEMBLY_ACC=CAM_ASM_000229 /LENGTH=103 /DNA_ID=CAMNT_0017752549 /DNA_START=1586 /DNA_END=1897 /DNA_ORIENTATION=+
MLSVINVGLLTYADEKFGAAQSFDEFLKTEFGGSMKEFLRNRKKVATAQRMEILLAGRVDVPKIICNKGLTIANENDMQVVPLAIKKDTPSQKFRIPFKNIGQ